MEERIKMNTESLQKHCRKEYEDFFAKNDLVLSGNFNCSRSPVGVGKPNAIFSIKQKLPTKCYVWFSKNNQKKITIDEISFFDLIKQEFVHENFKNVHKQYEVLINHINTFLKKHAIEHGYTISIISENMRGHGIGFSWTMVALLALWLFLLAKKVTIQEVENYEKFLASDIYKEIHILARELDFIARYGNSLGTNSLSAFLPTPNPIVFFTEYVDSHGKIEEIENKKTFYKDLCEECKTEATPIESTLPMDYAMVFSGQESHTDTVEYYRNKDLVTTKTILDGWKNMYYKKWWDLPSNKVFSQDFIGDTYDNSLMIINFKLLDSFKHILNDSYHIQNVKTFAEVINDYRRHSAIIEKQSDFAEDFIYAYTTESKSHAPIIGMMPVYSGKFWGGYLVMMPKGTYREIIEKTVINIQQKHPDCRIEYASWIDGKASDGVKIEQHISEGLFSSYIQKDKVYVKSTIGKNYIGDYNEIINSLKEGLILNTINNKMYLNGKKLDSNDLKSQTTTINILCMLLNNIGNDISNKELEISSYSKNKNEMLGKIIIPLIAFLEKEMGERLPLICKGSIYDFYIKLNPTTIPIHIISKI